MGNEFGHPEWIDFPRDGNGWSYKYARRQWNLADDNNLKYHYMGDFDKAMISLINSVLNFQDSVIIKICDRNDDNILSYMRGDMLFVFNFHPFNSYTNYGLLVPQDEYEIILDTDDKEFGGFGLNDKSVHHFTHFDPLYVQDGKGWLKLYLPARTAIVLKRNNSKN
jgi:1,4-alpha-glucan branching enzyme